MPSRAGDGVTSPGFDARADSQNLLAAMLARPWGHTSPSVYETGRLVTLAPWLSGHQARLDFLTTHQHDDGGWGGPDGYAIVPTLSATEALLATLSREVDRPGSQPLPRQRLTRGARLGLRALARLLRPDTGADLPDTPAVEIIIPALLASINAHLDRIADDPSAGLDEWHGPRLAPPAGTDGALLRALRERVAAGGQIPDKLLHSMEILGDAVGDAAGVTPAAVGPGQHATVGASPAATAAWLIARGLTGADQRHHPAHRYLTDVVTHFGGPAPSVYPITVFERGWVLNALTRCGLRPRPPAPLLASLTDSLGPQGTAGGAGLPPDADSTAMALLVLSELDQPRELDLLRPFETDTHFRTWAGERTPSATVNAHVLDAFGRHHGGADPPRRAAVIGKVSAWLRERQAPDGSWQDKWHASPYYATARCVLPLDRFGGPTSQPAVRRAVDWVLATQRTDGSWGRWGATAEETAYALQVLLLTAPSATHPVGPAAARGYHYLRRTWPQGTDEPGTWSHPPLWHDKDLYLPAAIVRANALGAMHLARRDPAVAGLVMSD